MNAEEDDIRPEYGFAGAVQGKHYKQYWADHGLIVLAEDLRESFPDAAAVNQALRLLLSSRKQIAGVA